MQLLRAPSGQEVFGLLLQRSLAHYGDLPLSCVDGAVKWTSIFFGNEERLASAFAKVLSLDQCRALLGFSSGAGYANRDRALMNLSACAEACATLEAQLLRQLIALPEATEKLLVVLVLAALAADSAFHAHAPPRHVLQLLVSALIAREQAHRDVSQCNAVATFLEARALALGTPMRAAWTKPEFIVVVCLAHEISLHRLTPDASRAGLTLVPKYEDALDDRFPCSQFTHNTGYSTHLFARAIAVHLANRFDVADLNTTQTYLGRGALANGLRAELVADFAGKDVRRRASNLMYCRAKRYVDPRLTGPVDEEEERQGIKRLLEEDIARRVDLFDDLYEDGNEAYNPDV
jgi:hypothetical protein